MRFFALKESNIISLHCMALITAAGDKGINVKTVSELTKCSRHHLAKLMDKLIKADLVKAKRGQMGGFYLKKDPKDIMIIDVFEAISGKVNTDVMCASGRDLSKGKSHLFGSLCKEMAEEFTEHIRKTSLYDIKDKASILLK